MVIFKASKNISVKLILLLIGGSLTVESLVLVPSPLWAVSGTGLLKLN